MYSIEVRNVNEALGRLVASLVGGWSLHAFASKEAASVVPPMWREIAPRGMETLEIVEPVTTCYRRPIECVLFNPIREANPFFHFMEAVWMLSGNNDVTFLSKFNKKMSDFSDDGWSLHGAYGQRWTMYGQLETAIEMLREDPDTRRAVIALYQPELDAYYDGKDLPCNTTITFKVREGKLNMTVFNRSNDAIWGAYGANVVHFSVLQQYVAEMVGVAVGSYWQVSDSFHVYRTLYPHTSRLMRAIVEWPQAYTDPYTTEGTEELHDLPNMFHQGLPDDVSHLRQCCMDFIGFAFDKVATRGRDFGAPFLNNIAAPMLDAWHAYRNNDMDEAFLHTNRIERMDWGTACQLWLRRRRESPHSKYDDIMKNSKQRMN